MTTDPGFGYDDPIALARDLMEFEIEVSGNSAVITPTDSGISMAFPLSDRTRTALTEKLGVPTTVANSRSNAQATVRTTLGAWDIYCRSIGR